MSISRRRAKARRLDRAIASNPANPARVRVRALQRLSAELTPDVMRTLILATAETVADPRAVDWLMRWYHELAPAPADPAGLRNPEGSSESSPEDRVKLAKARKINTDGSAGGCRCFILPIGGLRKRQRSPMCIAVGAE